MKTHISRRQTFEDLFQTVFPNSHLLHHVCACPPNTDTHHTVIVSLNLAVAEPVFGFI